uniref:G_PROTEIN_RECEP_F1_2 domain-containing protein n=1 Tax=Panagrellus redivivus TaxID=6233 RepID=A0A7E4VLG8_PANRE
MVLIILFTFVLFGCIVWFVVNVSQRRSNSISITKTAKSLIVSSLIQGFLCCIFLFLPIGTLTYIWAFKVEGSANIFNFVLFLVTSHGTVDMFCILIFVKPYRHYCWTLCLKLIRKLRFHGAVGNVSTLGIAVK